MGYTPPGNIDIGSPAVNRAARTPEGLYTYVNKNNPANSSGSITQIEIWADISLTGCEVATFYIVSGNNLSTRDTHYIGTVASGAKRTYSGLDITVESGDYLGIKYSSGQLDRALTDNGYWYSASDRIPCTNAAFTFSASKIISLYGTGITGAGELTIGDSFSIVDSLVRNASEQLAESWLIVDSFINRLTFGEALGIVDSIIKTGNKAISETVNVIDNWIVRVWKTEIFAIMDSFSKDASLAKAETLNIIDSWFSRVRLSETFQIVDSFAKTISYYFTEAFGITDSYRKSVNWIEEIKKTIDWTLVDDIGWFGGWFSKGWFSGYASWTEETKDIIVWNEETKI